jgi:hypothetical protein
MQPMPRLAAACIVRDRSKAACLLTRGAFFRAGHGPGEKEPDGQLQVVFHAESAVYSADAASREPDNAVMASHCTSTGSADSVGSLIGLSTLLTQLASHSRACVC